MKLEGKVALVTAGGAGIGRGITLCLAEEGADVIIADINKYSAQKVADEVKALGRKSLALEADITNSNRVAQVVEETLSAFGKIDILVNNVGSTAEAVGDRTKLQFANLEEWEWDKTIERNLKTQFLMCKAVVPHLQKQHSGKIVNVASIAAKRAFAPVNSYGPAKVGVLHFTLSLALELAKDNINVNCVCPGVVYTKALDNSTGVRMQYDPRPETKGMSARDYFLKYSLQRVPLGREQTPEDIGRAVVFFVSEDAKNITGQSLNIDGGMIPG
ncbi:MAG: SDR family NAD(P)-dependent oxidoreductase [Dehalococcoidales bacterium]|nr:SDR family NAD(P)-dependent oxidoreductase [Dehalococcoidales bacterium]